MKETKYITHREFAGLAQDRNCALVAKGGLGAGIGFALGHLPRSVNGHIALEEWTEKAIRLALYSGLGEAMRSPAERVLLVRGTDSGGLKFSPEEPDEVHQFYFLEGLPDETWLKELKKVFDVEYVFIPRGTATIDAAVFGRFGQGGNICRNFKITVIRELFRPLRPMGMHTYYSYRSHAIKLEAVRRMVEDMDAHFVDHERAPEVTIVPEDKRIIHVSFFDHGVRQPWHTVRFPADIVRADCSPDGILTAKDTIGYVWNVRVNDAETKEPESAGSADAKPLNSADAELLNDAIAVFKSTRRVTAAHFKDSLNVPLPVAEHAVDLILDRLASTRGSPAAGGSFAA